MMAFRISVVALMLVLCTGVSAGAPTTRRTVEPGGRAVVIALEGEINDFTFTMLRKRIDAAREMGATTIILKINTWGGAVLPAIEISQHLKRQDDLHTIAYVEQKAISAGAMIALACDEIVMEPGTMLGDCAPIVPGMQLEKTERAKGEGPILAEFAHSAERNGYDLLLVQSMVTVGRVVHYIQSPAGERKFVDAEEYDTLVKHGEWKPVEGLPNPIDDGDSLLTVTADQALRLGLSKSTVTSPTQLAAERGLMIVGTLEHSPGENLISLLSSTAVRGILSVIFMLSLYASFNAPGHGAAEAICLSSLALLVGVPFLTGYANWFEILLVIGGIVLLAVELFVIPGFGFAGITGIVMLLAGLVLTFVPAEPKLPGWMPALSGTWTAVWRGVIVLTSAMAASIVLGMWLNKFLPHIPFFKRLVLDTAVGTTPEVNYAALVDEPIWPEIGAVGRALTDLKPGGTAAFADPVSQTLQTTGVVSDSGFIAANTQIIVYEVHGNRIVVRPVETA